MIVLLGASLSLTNPVKANATSDAQFDGYQAGRRDAEKGLFPTYNDTVPKEKMQEPNYQDLYKVWYKEGWNDIYDRPFWLKLWIWFTKLL